MKQFCCLLALFFLSCSSKVSNEPVLVSIQLMDRNGVQETISQPERLNKYAGKTFLDPQPYEKVTCHYKNQNHSHSRVISYHKNGQVMQVLDVVAARAKGPYKEYFENGFVKLEAEVIEGIGDISEVAQQTWIFDGLSKVYYESGALKAQISYEKGQLQGVSLYYREDGTVHRQTPFESGLAQGEEVFFNPGGETLGTVQYVRGLKHGKAWFGSGLNGLNVLEYYSQGKLIEAEYRSNQGDVLSKVSEGSGLRTVFEKGRLARTEEIKEGFVEGKVSYYGNLKNLEHVLTQKGGMKEGEELFYHPNGKTKLKIHWENDQIHGIVQSWYENGLVESERMYASNKKEGTAFAWYQDGSRMLIEEYENDLLIQGRYYKKGDNEPVSRVKEGDGLATLYDAKGNFLKKIPYRKGLPAHG